MLNARFADTVVGQLRRLFMSDADVPLCEALEFVRVRAQEGEVPNERGVWLALRKRIEMLCKEVARMDFACAANDPGDVCPAVVAYGPASEARAIGRSNAKGLHAVDQQDPWEMRRAIQWQPSKTAEGILLSIAEARLAFLEEADPKVLGVSMRTRQRYLRLLAELDFAFSQMSFAFAAAA